jgi:LCP family protein required for cell wall assembly
VPFGGRSARWVRRLALVALLAVAAYLLAVPILAFSRVSRVDADPGGQRPPEQPGTTYLLVGTDSRAGLTATERRRLHTGRGRGSRADTIMLLHTGNGPNLLMSIPRASVVDVPGHGRSMLNGAYEYGGPELLVETIEKATGIRVDHFVQIGFRGVVGLVDAVGGVTICPAVAMDDQSAGLHVRPGCQTADGRRALAYARSRHAQQRDDLDRAAHQRELVAAVGAQVLSWRTFLDPVRYWDVMRGGAASVAVDDGMGPLAFARLSSALRHVDAPNGLTCGVPITDAAVQSVHWDPERAARMFELIGEDRTDQIDADLCQLSGLAR